MADSSPFSHGFNGPINHLKHAPEPPILDTVLEHIGNTPLVRLNRIPQSYGIKCEVLVKCEFFNAGGSVKDRIGKRMVEEAERAGILKPGSTIIEPTSGNTGIGLALAGAIKGYRVIITLPEKMSREKVDVMKALGAEIIRTPTEAAWDSPDSHIGVAKKLNAEIPNSVILDQYANPYNPVAHYDHTAEEILLQCDGKIDMLVAGAGTGGTISGIATKLKSRIPGVKIVGVDPIGSILAEPDSFNQEVIAYEVEGIGYDFIPNVLNRSLIDEWVKTGDEESFLMARRLIREEGLLCGGSSGTAVAAAMRAAKHLHEGQRCVIILPDSVRNYMTKFLNDDWMITHGFLKKESMDDGGNSKITAAAVDDHDHWGNATIADLHLADAVCIPVSTTCREAVNIMSQNRFHQLPVVSSKHTIIGTVTLDIVLSNLNSGKAKSDSSVHDAMIIITDGKHPYQEITVNTTLRELNKFFESHNHAAAIVTERKPAKSDVVSVKDMVVKHVVTKIDLLKWLTNK